MVDTRTYVVKGMRVLFPTDKTRAKNPNLAFTVNGKFFTEDGKTPFSFTTKAILVTQLGDVSVNLDKGTLTIPAGHRGAPNRETATQAQIDALINSAKSASK